MIPGRRGNQQLQRPPSNPASLNMLNMFPTAGQTPEPDFGSHLRAGFSPRVSSSCSS
jgi:hypothetical protein